MRIDKSKLDIELARNCKCLSDMRCEGLSPQTLQRAKNGKNLTPGTVGRIAKVLGVDPVAILMEE